MKGDSPDQMYETFYALEEGDHATVTALKGQNNETMDTERATYQGTVLDTTYNPKNASRTVVLDTPDGHLRLSFYDIKENNMGFKTRAIRTQIEASPSWGGMMDAWTGDVKALDAH